MKSKIILVIAVFVLLFTAQNSIAQQWKGQWVWQDQDGPANSWVCFRKSVSLDTEPKSAKAVIAVDSAYWIWINGQCIYRDGGQKRGPNYHDTCYDEIDLVDHLRKGSNTIAIMVSYWGIHSKMYNCSGKGGLFFQADIDDELVVTDRTWKCKQNAAFRDLDPNIYTQSHIAGVRPIKFDASRDIPGWYLPDFDDSTWDHAAEKGVPPCRPWGNLIKNIVPLWKDYGLSNYSNRPLLGLPREGDGSAIICKTPYNGHYNMYLKVSSKEPGKVIKLQAHSADYINPATKKLFAAEYLTKGGGQDEEFELPVWLNGDALKYIVPKGVIVKDLKFRETSYDTTIAGSFSCDDQWCNRFWEKAVITTMVNMRHAWMACPDRERTMWLGDAVIEKDITSYFFSRSSDKLSAYSYRLMVDCQCTEENKGIIYFPEPYSDPFTHYELPHQVLAVIGYDGIWKYYLNSGDIESVKYLYPHVKRYLSLFTFKNGLPEYREGSWDWDDWGEGHHDGKITQRCWYYWALKGAREMAILIGNTADVADYEKKMTLIKANFDKTFWDPQVSAYRTGTLPPDDRANAMAVYTGLSREGRYRGIKEVLTKTKCCGPWLEYYVEQALMIMGEENLAFERMKQRFSPMLEMPYSTLYERFPTDGSNNHAWAGGPAVMFAQNYAGVAPETAGYKTYHVLPQMGPLRSIKLTIPSLSGDIKVTLDRTANRFALNLDSPAETTATVGIPKDVFEEFELPVKTVIVGNTVLWKNGACLDAVDGVTSDIEDKDFIRFKVAPGKYFFQALSVE